MTPYIYPIMDCYSPPKLEVYEIGELVDGYVYHYIASGLRKVAKKT